MLDSSDIVGLVSSETKEKEAEEGLQRKWHKKAPIS